MARTTTINGTEYKVRWNGTIQVTDAYYLIHEDTPRKHRGQRIEAGWAVYHNDGSTPLTQHGDDQAAAVEAAKAAQARADERKAAKAAEQAKKEAADAERAALIAEKGPLATGPQVAYIMDLIHQGRHKEGGFYTGPTTREGVARLTKAEASTYITSLTGNY